LKLVILSKVLIRLEANYLQRRISRELSVTQDYIRGIQRSLSAYRLPYPLS
ncbi:hypothetical protein K504DRAFT_379573, partial [Pleomassaria siparia CBS 279.74]